LIKLFLALRRTVWVILKSRRLDVSGERGEAAFNSKAVRIALLDCTIVKLHSILASIYGAKYITIDSETLTAFNSRVDIRNEITKGT